MKMGMGMRARAINEDAMDEDEFDDEGN